MGAELATDFLRGLELPTQGLGGRVPQCPSIWFAEIGLLGLNESEFPMTMNDTKTFDPKTCWDDLKTAMEAGGAQGAIAHVESLDDPAHQRKLTMFAVRAFDGREWSGKGFDAQIEFARWGIALGVRQAEAESDPAERNKRIEFSNVLSYNFSANLAGCWPGDERVREPWVFEAGLQAAEDCLRRRTQLKKGPFPFSIAHWAKGMHLISLGRDGTTDMQASLELARQLAVAEGKPTDVSPAGTFAASRSSIRTSSTSSSNDARSTP